jgi:uncharacterized RDD family membrane protein YckC
VSGDLNLGFDFQETGNGNAAAKEGRAEVSQAFVDENKLDISLQGPASREFDIPILDALPLEYTDGESSISEVEASHEPADDAKIEPMPLEIVLESPMLAEDPAAPPMGSHLPRTAPIGRRFLAGLADTLVLLSAAGLFGIVFWWAGGRLSLERLNLLVLAFIAGFFVLVYFALFTALTSSTPGLLWMGLEVRNAEGNYPGAWQSAWRAFGYLVSVAGAMLGFIWALVDSERLTWHDRISGTCLVIAQRDRN